MFSYCVVSIEYCVEKQVSIIVARGSTLVKWGEGGNGAGLGAYDGKYSKTFENCIETIEKCIEIFETWCKTFKNNQKLRMVNWRVDG
jgi:hypothetical protein